MDGIELREATIDDVDQIASVFIEARTRCLAFLNWTYSQDVMAEIFARHLSRMAIWVALLDGQVVGFIGFTPDEVDHLYVLPELHGHGIGSRLLQQALKGESKEIRLWVFQENRQARVFYERHGFTLEFETDGQDNMEKTPDARYVLRR